MSLLTCLQVQTTPQAHRTTPPSCTNYLHAPRGFGHINSPTLSTHIITSASAYVHPCQRRERGGWRLDTDLSLAPPPTKCDSRCFSAAPSSFSPCPCCSLGDAPLSWRWAVALLYQDQHNHCGHPPSAPSSWLPGTTPPHTHTPTTTQPREEENPPLSKHSRLRTLHPHQYHNSHATNSSKKRRRD